MKKCIKCGSHAFNLYAEEIDQGGLCDVHYWQGRAHRAEAQPEQAPVASYLPEMSIPNFSTRVAWGAPDHIDLRNGWRPLYITPQARPWVGLTAQEAADCWTTSATKTWHNFEAALRSKNT